MAQTVTWDGYKYQVVDEADIGGGWDDVQGPIGQAGGVAALTFEAYGTTNYNAYFFRHDQNDTLYLEFQMPHSWDKSQVRPHIHLVPMADPVADQNIYFQGEYAWVQNRKTAPVSAWTAFSATYTVTPGSGQKEAIVSLVQVPPPTDANESDVLLVWVRRSGNDPLDTYTTSKANGTPAANVAVISIDCHFRKEKSGTIQEYPGA